MRAGPRAASPATSPSATETAITTNTVNAPNSRDVPATRWRFDSSVTATVRVRPGIRMMMPARVARFTAIGPARCDIVTATADARNAASGSNSRATAARRVATTARMPVSRPMAAAAATSRAPPARNVAAHAEDRANASTRR